MIDRSLEGSSLDKVLLACKNSVKADVDQKSKTLNWKSPDGDDIIKEVEIKFDGLSREVINWASLNEGDLIFNIDLSGRRRIYIISEVVYASKTSISVKIDGNGKGEFETVKVNLKIPVAFSYAKFPINQNGEIKQVIDDKDFNVASTFSPTKF